jgi:hypothetical protein
MSLFPFSTRERNDEEMPVAAVTSLSESDFACRAARSAEPSPAGVSTVATRGTLAAGTPGLTSHHRIIN